LEAALTAVLVILLLAFVAIAGTAIFIFVSVLKRQREFRKDFNSRWNSRL
jgi:hypothetical protein